MKSLSIEILTHQMTADDLQQMAKGLFGDMLKAVVDIERELIAVDGELHSDLEALLIDDGSRQKNLWGINIYPELCGDDFIEFDSMINVRPSQGNRSRGVENPETRERINRVVARWIKR